MDKELRYIHQSNLHPYWELIKPGLSKVKEHSTDGWIEEDVYVSLKNGSSTLHVGYIDGEYVGFVILSPKQGYNAIKLMVWCVYAQTDYDPIDTFIEDLKQMGRNIGAKQLTFASPRDWTRRLKKYGWVPVKQTFAMEI